jgi:hypothetical protein
MVLERLVRQVADVDPDRSRSELEQQPTHPRLELRGPLARDRRPARVRPAGDVQDGLVPDRREGAERVQEPVHELRDDRLEVRLRRDLRRETMPDVQLEQSATQQLPI